MNMGTKQTCMYCKDEEKEDKPILEIHSRGKYKGKHICWVCLKRKVEVILEYERRLQER